MKNDYNFWKLKLIRANNGEGLTILPYIKKQFGHLKFGDAMYSILKNIYYKDYFAIELFPKDVNGIITYDCIPLSIDSHNINETSIINEIECFLSMFNNLKDRLILFSQYRNRFEKHLFSGEYEMSQKVLEQIESSFGYSFWLIESKFLLSNYTMNVVETERYYQKLKDECSDYYIKNFIRAIRRKTNMNENVRDSISFIKKKQNDFSIPSKSIEIYKQIYFELYNNSIDTMNFTMAYYLLSMATRLNLIDMFLLIEKIIVQVMCDGSFGASNIERLLSVLNTYQLPFVFKKSCDILNDYFDYNDALTQTIYNLKRKLYNFESDCDLTYWSHTLEEFPTSFDMIVTYAKMEIIYSYSMPTDNTLLKFIIDIVKISILKKGDYKVFCRVSNDAIRLLLLLSSTTLNYGYSNFYYDTFNADTSQSIRAIFASNYYNRHMYYYIKPNDNVKAFTDSFGPYESDWYHSIKYDNNLLYDKISECLFGISSNETALERLHLQIEKDICPASIIVDNRCCEKLFEVYLQSNKIQKAIGLYVDLQFISKFKVSSYKNEVLAKKCNGMVLPTLYKDINFCIYAHLTDFRGALGLRFNTQCANSLMSILKSKSIVFPSELYLEPDASDLHKAKYAYLFRHICETDLLTSKLVANGIDEEDVVEQKKLVLEERIKLLRLALELDTEDEKTQILQQINEIENEIDSLGNVSLEDTLISYAKILKSAVCVSDTEVILPFYYGLRRITEEIQEYNFSDYFSGEFSIFRDLFVRYKKEYIKCLDQQIGINIRHGFLKNEVLSFFSKYSIVFEKLPSKEDEEPKCIEIMINKLKSHPKDAYLIEYVNNIVVFSKKLYYFITNLLSQITITHISNPSENASQIFFDNEYISKIAYCLLKVNNPYEFKGELDVLMGNYFEEKLKTLGEYVENAIIVECTKLIDESFEESAKKDAVLASNIINVKSNILELAGRIKKWFEYIKDGNKICSINKYFILLQKKYSFVNYNLSDTLPDEIKFYQLHCLDIILSNLIMNAKEHSGLHEDSLIIYTSVGITNDIMKIYFRNNLHNIKKSEILEKIQQLEVNLDQARNNNHSTRGNGNGNGFKHIAETLNALNDAKWKLVFCKDDLPNFFALTIEIDWRNDIAKDPSH